MLRVVVALLLAAAALAAVDLSGLVDVVYNKFSPLERFAPTYVFEIDGCRVLVYVVNSTLKSTPVTAYQTYDEVRFSANKTLRSITSAEVEKLLDALFQALGPSAEAWVVVRTNSKLWCGEKRGENLRSETRDVAQLAEEVRRVLEAESAERMTVAGTDFTWLCAKRPSEDSHVETKDAAQAAEEAHRATKAEGTRAEGDVRTNSTWNCAKSSEGDIRIETMDAAQLAEEVQRAMEVITAMDVVVYGTDFTWWCTKIRGEFLHVYAKSATQLAEEVQKAVGVDFYLSDTDAQEALKRGAEPVAYLSLMEWRREDLVVIVQLGGFASLEVKTANLSATVEVLKRMREAVGEAWNNVVVVELWYGPYFVPADAAKNLTEAALKAALMLKKELGEVQESGDEEEWMRWVRGDVLIFFENELGPLYVILPYLSSTAPDGATAERLVRRFVELSGFCKSPLVVEFRLRVKPPPPPHSPPLWPYIAAVGAALAVAIGLVLTRRRR